MALNGAWEDIATTQVYTFDEAAKTVAIATPPSKAVVYTFSLNPAGSTLSFTQVAAGSSDATADVGKVNKYEIQTRTDTRITLRRVPVEGDDTMDEEVLVLTPVGLPESLRNNNNLDEDDDGNDSGVDMGMDLCIVGKKI